MEPLSEEHKRGLEKCLGNAIALVDFLVAKHKLDRLAIANHAAEARKNMEDVDAPSHD